MRNRQLLAHIATTTILVILATLLIPIGSGQPANAQEDELCASSGVSPFEDVLDGDYGSDYILCAKTLGLTLGTSEGIFEPQEKLTRAQMATFLVRLWRDIIGNDCPATRHPFTDVAAGSTHEADIACLASLGVTKGVAAQRYEPRGALKTSQMTRFTVRMLNLISPGTCDTSSIELTQAAACLAALNIAPSIEEARSTVAVSRAQMVVYLVGLWRHAAEGDYPPTPPTRATWKVNQENTMVAIGLAHSCWLSVIGTVTCTGQSGNVTDPEGTFTSVTAGHGFSCGIRPQGSIVCWGDNSEGQLQAPTGSFVTITAGSAHSCGLRVDGAIQCWGRADAGQVDAPDERFSTVTAGFAHSCGLTVGGAVRCWGDSRYGQADAPIGRFIAVGAGQAHSCGVRVGGTVECWGDNRYGQADAPRGRFTQVIGGLGHSCGLQTRGGIWCWGDNRFGQTDAPEGRFTRMWPGLLQSCALSSEGEITCWGD